MVSGGGIRTRDPLLPKYIVAFFLNYYAAPRRLRFVSLAAGKGTGLSVKFIRARSSYSQALKAPEVRPRYPRARVPGVSDASWGILEPSFTQIRPARACVLRSRHCGRVCKLLTSKVGASLGA